MLLGIDIFSAMSLVSALLDKDIPSSAQWLFQGAAAMGLGQLFISQGFITSGVFTRDPTDPTRFWISVIYLAAAISNVVGLNIYLGAIRRKLTLASMFGGTVTVPTVMTSAFFISSFVASGGDVNINSSSIALLLVSAAVSGLSIFGFLRQALKHTGAALIEKQIQTAMRPATADNARRTPVETIPAPTAPNESTGLFDFLLPTKPGSEWEEAPVGEEGRGGEN